MWWEHRQRRLWPIKSSKCIIVTSHYARVSVAISTLSYFNFVAEAWAFYLVRASDGFEARHSDSIHYSCLIVWCYPMHTCCAMCFLKGNSYTNVIYIRYIPFLTQDVARWQITHLKVLDILTNTQEIWTVITRFLYHTTWRWTFPSSILNWGFIIHHAGKHIVVTSGFYTAVYNTICFFL